MPAASPWMSYDAPAQYTLNTGVDPTVIPGVAGSANSGPLGFLGVNTQASNSGVDSTLHIKVAGAIVLALAVVFALHAMGFRFVTSANASFRT